MTDQQTSQTKQRSEADNAAIAGSLVASFNALGHSDRMGIFYQVYTAGADGIRPKNLDVGDTQQAVVHQQISRLVESGLVEKRSVSTPGEPGRGVLLTVPTGGIAEAVGQFIDGLTWDFGARVSE